MAGRAILTAEPIKGVIKELSVAIIKTDFFRAASSFVIESMFFIETGVSIMVINLKSLILL
jgi:hypothetical protein